MRLRVDESVSESQSAGGTRAQRTFFLLAVMQAVLIVLHLRILIDSLLLPLPLALSALLPTLLRTRRRHLPPHLLLHLLSLRLMLLMSLRPLHRLHRDVLVPALRRNNRRRSALCILCFFSCQFDELVGESVGGGVEFDEA